MMKTLAALLRPVHRMRFHMFSSFIRATFDPENFVRRSKHIFEMWKERLALLSDDDKNALAVDMDKIMFAGAEHTGFYLDSAGRLCCNLDRLLV